MIYFGIWREVQDDVTGPRHGWLKSNGEICRFATPADAEREAASLNKAMNGPNAKASFRYTATILGDTDVDEAFPPGNFRTLPKRRPPGSWRDNDPAFIVQPRPAHA